MNDMRSIHETIVKDVIDLIKDVKTSDVQKIINNKKGGNSFKSITAKSEALTLVFPCVCSRSMQYDRANLMSKSIEKKAVVIMHMLFAAASLTDATSATEFISKFHTNLNASEMNLDDFIGAMDDFVKESGFVDVQHEEDYYAAKKDLANLNFFLESNFNDNSINRYNVVNRDGITHCISEDVNDDLTKAFTDAAKGAVKAEMKKQTDSKAKDDADKISNAKEQNMRDKTKLNFDIEKNRVFDEEIKKANELVPTLMYINFSTTKDNYAVVSQAVIGIKAKLYAADPSDIMNRLTVKVADSNLLLNLVKASTREISFVKDFIFAIDKAKVDALSQSRKGSSNKLWKVLERRALKSKIRRSFGSVNDATAITTLCITQEEADYMKHNMNVNVENPQIIRKILEAYNLMGFVIVDETLGIAKFIDDTGDDSYELITFDNLEREAKDNSKKILNLMAKVSR